MVLEGVVNLEIGNEVLESEESSLFLNGNDHGAKGSRGGRSHGRPSLLGNEDVPNHKVVEH